MTIFQVNSCEKKIDENYHSHRTVVKSQKGHETCVTDARLEVVVFTEWNASSTLAVTPAQQRYHLVLNQQILLQFNRNSTAIQTVSGPVTACLTVMQNPQDQNLTASSCVNHGKLFNTETWASWIGSPIEGPDGLRNIWKEGQRCMNMDEVCYTLSHT